MTIEATAGLQEDATLDTSTTRQPIRTVGHRGMTLHLVALLAQERGPRLQQRGLRRAVRVVAVGAILGHRLMLPQERSTIFSVTGRAGFGHRAALQRGRRVGPMWRMAACASHLAFDQGMVGGLEGVCCAGLVAARADHCLRLEITHGIFGLMQGVAVCACHLIARVSIGTPVRSVLGVASQALLVLGGFRSIGFLAETNHARASLSFPIGVRISRPMARLALQLAMTEG